MTDYAENKQQPTRAVLEQMVGALDDLAKALPVERSTTKTCYAVHDGHRDAVHAALTAGRAVLEKEEAGADHEHIGKLNPDHPHRLKCKRCGSEAGQVLRSSSDFFDCLCCGSFTYIKGVNLNTHHQASEPAIKDGLEAGKKSAYSS